jgi:hypothetical protein
MRMSKAGSEFTQVVQDFRIVDADQNQSPKVIATGISCPPGGLGFRRLLET